MQRTDMWSRWKAGQSLHQGLTQCDKKILIATFYSHPLSWFQ